MPDSTSKVRPALRQRIAAVTPGWLRKIVRMGEHYSNRMHSWRDVRREFVPADARSKTILRRSYLMAPVTALGDLDSFQPPRIAGDVDVEIVGVGLFHIRAGTDDVLHVLTAREPQIRRLLEQRLGKGGTFVDAGANIGFYSLLAAQIVGREGQIVAFEMMPDTAAILRRHVELNAAHQVRIVERALSDRSGDHVSASVEPGKHGQASIVTDNRINSRITVEVETVTLDEALRGIERIDLLKMDLEGAEFLAMSGGGSVLARTGCIVFESNDEDPRVFALLKSHGFSVKRLEGYDFIAQAPGTAP